MHEHTAEVARRARGHAGAFGAADWGYWAGVLHDLGKYRADFQRYLDACHGARQAGRPEPRGGVDHKGPGAHWAHTVLRNDLLAMVALGHHGGLPSPSDAKEALTKARAAPDLPGVLAGAESDLPALRVPQPLTLPPWAKAPLDAEVFLRMLYSCLVDADSLDTEQHFEPAKATARHHDHPLEEYLARLERSQEGLTKGLRAPNSAVNRVRREVYEACCLAADEAPGVFHLTVPTGGGKTRSSLAFALRHALKHGRNRVIYALPYTSIIDQTVRVFRGILGEGAEDPPLLEHHSALPEPTLDTEETERAELWRRLASENWDAPLIVTTTVQLFESLFSHKPSRCRKLHRLARSVLILDEVQTLPVPLLQPIVDALRALAQDYGTTVVLCTATQSALDGESPYLTGFPEVRPIVAPEARDRHFQQLRRVRYRIEPAPWSWPHAAEEMAAEPQCLAVLNTRKDALALVEALRALGVEEVHHLSTLLCGAHRRRILQRVRERLASGEPVRLVSTQVVEAGVDIDFPKVMRALGPLDRIIQAAGRCNREGRLDRGEVVVFVPEAGGSPGGVYRTALDEAGVFLQQPCLDLSHPATTERYFRQLYGLTSTDAKGIQADRAALSFPTVADKFRMIDGDTVPVLVRYEAEAGEVEEILSTARALGRMTRGLWRRAQSLTVSLFRRDFVEGLRSTIEVVVPDQLYLWCGDYDELTGLGGVARDPADLILG